MFVVCARYTVTKSQDTWPGSNIAVLLLLFFVLFFSCTECASNIPKNQSHTNPRRFEMGIWVLMMCLLDLFEFECDCDRADHLRNTWSFWTLWKWGARIGVILLVVCILWCQSHPEVYHGLIGHQFLVPPTTAPTIDEDSKYLGVPVPDWESKYSSRTNFEDCWSTRWVPEWIREY